MPARFLGKTSLAELTPLRAGGRPVLEQYESLRAALAASAGSAAAELFAEPIVTWGNGGAPGSVSWYAPALGEAEPFHTLSADRRQRLETTLRTVLSTLEPLLLDQAIGPLLQCALVIGSRDGIRAVDDRVILTDWGLAPPDAAAAPDPLARLANSPLAGFLTVPTAEPRPARPAAAPVPPPPPPRAAPPPAPAPAPAPVMVRVVDRTAWNWWFLPAALVVAALFLILGLWLGARLVADRIAARPSTVSLFDENTMRQAIERQKQENAALESQVEERRKALDGNVCKADPAQMPRIGPDRDAAVQPSATPPPPGQGQFQGSLTDLLKQAAVFVIAPISHGVSYGSGFFVTPDLIVTNRHVVEQGDPEKVFVTNSKLGQLTKAHIVAMTPSSTIGQLDVALLKLDAPAQVQPLSVTTSVAELDPVIAAGFPQVTVSADETYERLLHGGDTTAVPPMIFTDGKISAIQETASGLKIMPHTANISGGNSGGPLVDACGRVVGINTFIAVDRSQAASAKWAQKIDQVVDFLASKGTVLTPLTDKCNPAAAASPPPAAPAPGSSTPPASPPAQAAPSAPAPGAPASPAH